MKDRDRPEPFTGESEPAFSVWELLPVFVVGLALFLFVLEMLS